MKIQKILAVIVISISILFGVLTTRNEAVNETTNNTSSTNSTNSTNNTSNTNSAKNVSTRENTNNSTQEKASSNANLSNLGIKPHDFTGFKYEITSYEATVPEDTETVEVYAKAQDAKAKITGTGKKTLEKGENKVEVVVTAEDGTTRTYTINIIREVKQENYDEAEQETNQQSGNGLAKLKINDLNLSPEFKTNVYEYTVKYIGEDTKLNIETEPTKKDYVVEIVGNEKLQEGENFITILVSEANGDNVATYQVTVNKSLVDQEAIEKEKEEKMQKAIIAGIAGIIIVVIIIIVIIIRRRNRKFEEEFSYEENDLEEDIEEEEIPKALRKDQSEEEDVDEEFEETEEKELTENDLKEDNEDIEEEEDFEKMPKEQLRERFLNNYNSQIDFDYDEADQQNNNKKGKHKGKRFK